jgi:uncharacterized membrane protein YedE/YeeE
MVDARRGCGSSAGVVVAEGQVRIVIWTKVSGNRSIGFCMFVVLSLQQKPVSRTAAQPNNYQLESPAAKPGASAAVVAQTSANASTQV